MGKRSAVASLVCKIILMIAFQVSSISKPNGRRIITLGQLSHPTSTGNKDLIHSFQRGAIYENTGKPTFEILMVHSDHLVIETCIDEIRGRLCLVHPESPHWRCDDSVNESCFEPAHVIDTTKHFFPSHNSRRFV